MRDYFLEVRYRLILIIIFFIISFVISYILAARIYDLLLYPVNSLKNIKLIYTHLFEAFFTYLKTAFISSSLLTIPFIISQIYIYLAPALYKKEKKVFWLYIIFSSFLFLLSIIMVYFYILPLVWHFFLKFECENLTFLPQISNYLSVVFALFTGFIMMFQLPLLLIFLSHLKIINAQHLKRFRKIIVIIIFIVAAFVTPPDIISQVLLAIPMLILYEITILIISKINKKNKLIK